MSDGKGKDEAIKTQKSDNFLLSRVRNYAEHSTIKCLPKFVRANSVPHKVLWAATFVIGVVIGLNLLSGLWATYFSYQITLSISAEEGGKPPFPDVTVCNLNPLWNNAPGWGLLAEVEGVDHPLTYDEYIYLLYSTLYKPQSNDTVFEGTNEELYSVAGYLKHTKYDKAVLEDLGKRFIWKCVWQTETQSKNCTVIPTITPTNGLCYTIRPPPGEGVNVRTRQEGLSVILFLNNLDIRFVADYRISPFQSYTEGAKVLLHPRGTVPQMVEGFTVAPGSEASVVTKYYHRKILPQPYGNCEEDLKLDMFDNINAADVWSYTKYACNSLCYQSQIIADCGCLDVTEITFNELTEKYRYCSIFSERNASETLMDLECTRNAKKNVDLHKTCSEKCRVPCRWNFYKASMNQVPWPHEIYILALYYTYMRYRNLPKEFQTFYGTAVEYAMRGNTSEATNLVQSTNLIQRNFLQFSITMDDTITWEEDKPAIKMEALFGSIGGILNLWIGFTFITVMEIVDFVLTIIMDKLCLTKKYDDNKRKKAISPATIHTIDSDIFQSSKKT